MISANFPTPLFSKSPHSIITTKSSLNFSPCLPHNSNSKTRDQPANKFSCFPNTRLRERSSAVRASVSSTGSGEAENWNQDCSTEGRELNLKADDSSAAKNRGSLLAKLTIAFGVAVSAAVIYIFSKSQLSGTSALSFPGSIAGAEKSVQGAIGGFDVKLFGQRVVIPEYAPGWVYFCLLMAAGCGLFISEEALNIWVGITLARRLAFDGSWNSFASSFSNNAVYIISTVLWVYWGVCISDMIPFYLGQLFSKTKASVGIWSKMGVPKDKADSITQAVQKYGNLIGIVERFSLGIRNPTAFLAGAMGIPPDCFFAGVCIGGVFTLSIQLGLGFLFRERPVVAVATVATVVGMWTIFPYILAGSTALFFYLRRRVSN